MPRRAAGTVPRLAAQPGRAGFAAPAVMPAWKHGAKRMLKILVASIALLVALPSAIAADDLTPSGTLTIEQTQIAFIGSGNLGGGTLSYEGKQYHFTVGGLGIGGFGISRIQAEGTVYNMRSLADFPGAYVQGRYGIAIGDAGGGGFWLQNSQGVVLKLSAQREGLALSLGADAVYINLD
jgi:hypothetical protein